MEMYNKDMAENAAMIIGTNVPVEPASLEQYPELNRLRRLLLVFVGIDLILVCSDSLETQSPQGSSQLSSVIILMIYYGLVYWSRIVTIQTGLLIYVILGFISFPFTITINIIILIRIIHTVNYEGFVSAGLIVAIIFVAISFLILIIQIFIVRYAFKLYTLLKHNKRLTIEQI